jgi:hypothetical protein
MTYKQVEAKRIELPTAKRPEVRHVEEPINDLGCEVSH